MDLMTWMKTSDPERFELYDMTSDPDWYIPKSDTTLALSPLATPFPTTPMRELLAINWRRNVSRIRNSI